MYLFMIGNKISRVDNTEIPTPREIAVCVVFICMYIQATTFMGNNRVEGSQVNN